MSRIHVVCDSTADLDTAYATAHDVAVVPLRVIFGEDEFLDGVDISTAEFYRRMQADPHLPRTSQPTPAEFEEVFRRVGGDGAAIVCTTISAELSGTYGSALQARAALPDLDIRVVDSRTVGPTHTAAVEVAVALRDQGRDADAVVAALARLREQQRLVFALETLEYLHRGGRIGGGQAFVGTVLSIKPILGMTDGKIEAVDRVRTYPAGAHPPRRGGGGGGARMGPDQGDLRPRRQARAGSDRGRAGGGDHRGAAADRRDRRGARLPCRPRRLRDRHAPRLRGRGLNPLDPSPVLASLVGCPINMR